MTLFRVFFLNRKPQTVQSTVYSVQCTVYSWQCTLYTAHCSLLPVPLCPFLRAFSRIGSHQLYKHDAAGLALNIDLRKGRSWRPNTGGIQEANMHSLQYQKFWCYIYINFMSGKEQVQTFSKCFMRLFHFIFFFSSSLLTIYDKSPAYGRHWISRPMRIVAPTPKVSKKFRELIFWANHPNLCPFEI